ncbi:hypothetical protein B0H14DRAFT_2611875 [Mycena olivaceomarginata]|nr:hypothetical protein B0H14DRAFT_2611875 [Mycena olivaceomarginata]
MSPESWGITSLLKRGFDPEQTRPPDQRCPRWREEPAVQYASMESTSFQRIEKMDPRELRPGGNSIGISIGIPFGTIGTLATSEARGARGPSKLTKAITRHWDRRFSTALALLCAISTGTRSRLHDPDRLGATQWTTGLGASLDHLHQKQAEVPFLFLLGKTAGSKPSKSSIRWLKLNFATICIRGRAQEGRTRVTGASPFPSCKLRISTEPSGPGRIGKDVLEDDLDEPGTCRNLSELANVGHCCGRLNIGIGIREWNEMQLPGVRLLASTEFARPARSGFDGFRSFETSDHNSDRKRTFRPMEAPCQERERSVLPLVHSHVCKVPGSLGALFGSAARPMC